MAGLDRNNDDSEITPDPGPTWPYILAILAIGLLLLLLSSYLRAVGVKHEVTLDFIKELGIVLVAACGISLFYEHLLAERHFGKFQFHLQQLVRQGETNAAVCADLGIIEIYRQRSEYENRHSFVKEAADLTSGDGIRIVGRSLYFSMLKWEELKDVLRRGAAIELCIIDPTMAEAPLDYLAGYSAAETRMVVDQLLPSFKSWLQTDRPSGTIEIRFHQIQLLDSLYCMRKRNSVRVAWDLNFSRGLNERKVFYLDGAGVLGKSLLEKRYNLIWEGSMLHFRYSDGKIEPSSDV